MPLITFEGIDGSGKSTQIELLVEWLRSQNLETLTLREPGGTELSEKVRTILLDKDLNISPVAELMLFSAARAQLVDEVIKAELQTNKWVILDRFFDSTTAYQGYGRKVASINEINALNKLATSSINPDITFLLDIPVDTAFKRNASKPKDRMESAGDAFFQKVQEAYRLLAEQEDRIIQIDASQSAKDVHHAIITAITNHPSLKLQPSR